MGFGRYRFRRSFGNVSSQFRGARFDTYPLTPYPLAGRVLDLSKFTFTSSDVPDISDEDNDAVLYSGKGVNLDGTGDDIKLPSIGTIRTAKMLVRSSSAPVVSLTDDVTLATVFSFAGTGGVWQELTLVFPTTPATNSTTLTASSCDIADLRLYDDDGDLLDEFYLNEHTDTAANGLDGLPVVGRNGNIGQYVGCAAVVQEAGDVGGLTPPQVLGMNFNQFLRFDQTGEKVTLPSATTFTNSDTFSIKFSLFLEDRFGAAGTGTGVFGSTTNAFAGLYLSEAETSIVRLTDDVLTNHIIANAVFPIGKVFELEIKDNSGNFQVFIDGVDVTFGTPAAITTFSIDILGEGRFRTPIGAITNVSITKNGTEVIAWDGSIKDAEAQGWTVNGTPDNLLVSESLNAGIDALGNALTPRTSKTFNADGSGYAIVPDDNSLDLTTEATWVMKGNFYSGALNETFIGKYDTGSKRSWWIYQTAADGSILISISSDGVVTTTHTLSGLTDEEGFLVITYNAGTIKTYWKGSLIDTDVSALTSLYVSDIDVGICSRIQSGGPSNVTSTPISDIKIYNRELTADEVATFV